MEAQALNEESTGHLVMRLHFVVTSFLNLTVRSAAGAVVVGHPVRARTTAEKRSHLMTVDKLVAEMRVGDAFLESAEQIQDRLVTQFRKDEGLEISDFDAFMPHGNPFLLM